MKYKAKVYGVAHDDPNLEITTDSYNLCVILESIAKQYGWVYKENWDGNSELNTEVGTIHQFNNNCTGRIVIERVK